MAKLVKVCPICGKEFITYSVSVNRGRGKYCSLKCYNQKRATLPNFTSLNNIFHLMKMRCYDINSKSYKDYGGRGITICQEWLNDKMKFYDWSINNGYEKGLTIDRINVNGNYEPNNCRWITKSQQTKNRRCNIMLCLADVCRIFNLPVDTIYARIKVYKWDVEKALTTPIKRH